MLRTLFYIAFLASLSQPSMGQIWFEDQAVQWGIRDGSAGYGVAVADYNRDGWEDVYLAATDGNSRLFRNLGGSRFEEVTVAAGVAVKGYAVAPLFGDINNDGWPDLFVGVRSDTDSSAFFVNQGDGTFIPAPSGHGIDLTASVGSVSFADFDKDGWLDLFVATRGSKDRLYRNLAGETIQFEDISSRAGIEGAETSIAMQATWVDYDRDGDQDLFAVHDGNLPSRFYRNNGWLPFTEVSTSSGLQVARSSMGVSWTDYDANGYPDVYVSNIAEGNFFANAGDGSFEDVTLETGTGLNGMSWGVVFADYDLDGDEDVFIANTYDFDRMRSFLYENREGDFVNIGEEAQAALNTNSFGAARGDFNRDGLPDLIVPDAKGQHRLLMNQSTTTGNWLGISLEGVRAPRSAFGSQVTVFANGKKFSRIVEGGSGFCSQMSSTVHVGLGDASVVDSVLVEWGSGTREVVDWPLASNQYVEMKEGTLSEVSTAFQVAPEWSTVKMQVFPHPVHREGVFQLELGSPDRIRLVLYDMLGRQRAVLIDQFVQAGQHRFPLALSHFPAGQYLLQLHTSVLQRGVPFVLAD